LLTGFGKGRQSRAYGYRRHIGQIGVHAIRQGYAELVHHVAESLVGKRRLVTSTIKTDHQAITNQLVVAHTFHLGQVFQTVGHHRRGTKGREDKDSNQFADHSGHHSLLKKRASQPIWLAWSKSPVPP